MTLCGKRALAGLLIVLGTAFGTAPVRAADATPLRTHSLAFQAELAATNKPTGVPPFDVHTGRFVEPPPTGFTEEEYRAAVKQSILDEIDRRASSGSFQGLDPEGVRRAILDGLERENLDRDTDAREAAASLWYSRTPPADIPPPPVPPRRFEVSDLPGLYQHVLIVAFVIGVSGAMAAIQQRVTTAEGGR